DFHFLHQLDVGDVLGGDLVYRDVENVEMLPPDQVQQQIQRPFEGLQNDTQRIRRDVQIFRQLGQRLAGHANGGQQFVPRRRSGGVSGNGVVVSRNHGHNAGTNPVAS